MDSVPPASRKIFLSTLSLRRATNYYTLLVHQNQISIHALLAESDLSSYSAKTMSALFLSTLSLRRATLSYFYIIKITGFLSTLSLRRATIVMVGPLMFNLYFYPRSPCGERQCRHKKHLISQVISIHALLAESDCIFL